MSQFTEIDIKDSLVLIVDDQPFNVRVLEEILKRQNYKYTVATNAAMAYEAMQKSPPDLLLLDIMMPGEDGYEFCQRIKKEPRYAGIPVIFLSAKVEVDDKIKGFQIGAVDYITKPFHASEVLARISTHIQLKKTKEFIKNYNQQLEQIIEVRTKELIKTEKQASFGQLMQGIIHNIRGPIASVISSFSLISFYREDIGDYLKEKPELMNEVDEKFKEIWDVIEQDDRMLNKLLKTIDAMMMKSRSDKSEVIEIIDLNEILGQEIEFLNAEPTFNKIEKKIELSPNALKIKVIPGEIAQVFGNVVKNALDAMYDKKDARIEIRSGRSESEVWFTVGDNGVGIPDNIKTKIFEPFYTTKRMKKEDGSKEPTGTGIGLHYCKQTVESYSGKIKVDSRQGEGTTFTITLPFSDK